MSPVRQAWLLSMGAALAVCAGCDDGGPGSNGTPATTKEPVLKLLAPQSPAWTRAQAVAHLDDPNMAVSAAIRLVRLAELTPLCAPGALTDRLIRRLRVVALNASWRALGYADRAGPDRLRAPVLIGADGAVRRIATGAAEEALILYVAEDAEIFPHVALLPHRVFVIEDELEQALSLEEPKDVRFAWREESGFPYVGLVLLPGGDGDEVARYTWDPYELVFFGPVVDKLPDPPGGKFELDLEASPRLIPRGGEIPEPEPLPERPPQVPDTPQKPWWLDDDGALPA